MNSMKQLENVSLIAPYLRVNNRQRNLDFYEQVLGLRVLNEENGLAVLGGQTRQPRLIIEESPAQRTRAVRGLKKLHTLFLQASAGEIAELLARQVPVDRVFQGSAGYGFYATSPEGDQLVLYGAADLTGVQGVSYPDLPASPDFTGLSDITVSSLSLNVPNPEQSAPFYADLPLSVTLLPAQGEDLTAPQDETWDLEVLEFAVPQELDLSEVAGYFAELGGEIFLNRKETLLVVTDPSKMELWFVK